MQLHDAERAFDAARRDGLTTREACGNSVRNITACQYAGTAADEIFDVTPYAEALTRYFLRHPLSASLPRKFKIAFEGCTEDHAYTGINDIGWRAATRQVGGRRELGFRVTVGGGTATMSRAGAVLFDFLPAGEMLNAAEAVVRVFHRLGDYQHKHKNRMKFLIKQLGWERFQTEVLQEYESVRASGGQRLPFPPDAPPVEEAPEWPRPPNRGSPRLRNARRRRRCGPRIHPDRDAGLQIQAPAYVSWQRTNVRPQKQPGYVLVTMRLPLGDFTGEQMRIIARPGGRLRRWRRAHHAGPEPRVPVGAGRPGRGALCATGGGRSRR